MDAEIWNQVNLWFWCWAGNWHKPSVSLLWKRTSNVYLMSSHFASLHHVAHSQMCKKPSCLARRHNGVSRAASLAATLLVAACYQCTVKHHTDIINFTCMMWNFVRISASLSALCTSFDQICHWHCISCKFLPHFDVRTISVAQKL